MADNTCDLCKHYTASSDATNYPNCGSCDLLNYLSSSGLPKSNTLPAQNGFKVWVDVPKSHGMYIGPKFGCLLWEAIS